MAGFLSTLAMRCEMATSFPNGVAVGANDLELLPGWQVAQVAATFDGGTTDARGDFDGTGNPTTLFNVTGVVAVQMFAVPSEDLAGASATIEVGVANNTAALIAQTTATDIDDGDIWRDAGPAVGAEALNDPIVVIDDIIETIATANITGGALTYYCLWFPISSDGLVEAA